CVAALESRRGCLVRSKPRGRRDSILAVDFALALALAMAALLAIPGTVLAAQGPVPVSPGAKSLGAAVEARCPTFLWAGIPRAPGYELAVFRLSEDGAAPALVTRASVPGDARGFTPPSSDCLERGQRYAWSVAAVAAAGAELDWSTPFLFEVEAAPSLDELEHAIATIERYRTHGRDGARPRAQGLDEATATSDHAREPVAADSPAERAHIRRPRVASDFDEPFAGAHTSSTSGVTRVASAATPALGAPSLRVSANVALGAASNLFKDDAVFLWDDTTGNTASGFWALYSNTIGFANTASGQRALQSNTEGRENTASGYRALGSNSTGGSNTAIGRGALLSNTTGYTNTAVGRDAGINATTGRDNIFLGSGATGNSSDTNTIRIGGTATGGATPGVGQQNRTFINGIRGITTANADAIAVLIDTAGQLGTSSSSRATKQDIQDLGPLADRLLELRPVAFRYRQHAATNPDTPLQFGLVAEEVAEVFPELVVFDEAGRPETVKYHLLSALLLGEVQWLHDRLETVESQGRPTGRRSKRPALPAGHEPTRDTKRSARR
ncbi:MAG TPA: tail fiber domain-containing protein, partial [Thermoanaerobaculia bacterium]|nr:tail fiber domain-containing protein [Thermoanaerobaculia bacterium]